MRWRDKFETPCTVSAEHSGASLHAHVELDGGYAVEPGDKVQVLGPPITLRFGQTLTIRRTARVSRANRIERLWTKLAGHFEMTELYEVSFTPGRAR